MLGSWDHRWRPPSPRSIELQEAEYRIQNTGPCCSLLPFLTHHPRYFRRVGSLDESFNVILQNELSRTRWNCVSC